MRKPLILKGSRLICPFSTVHTEREPLTGCEQVSGKKSQHKGRAGELELSRILRGCGYDVQPGRAVSYGATPDISGLPGIHIEVKRVERLNVPEAMKQAVKDAEKFHDGVPALFHRRSREPWLVTMRLQDWMGLYRMQKRPPSSE